MFDGEERELSNLCLVFREVINRLMLVVKIQHTLVRIKVKLVVRLRTARPGELIGEDVTLHSCGHFVHFVLVYFELMSVLCTYCGYSMYVYVCMLTSYDQWVWLCEQ